MKKSLLVISVILLIAGLFISCNSEAAESSNGLAEVKFAEAESKSLSSSVDASQDVLPEIADQCWWYKASKTTAGGTTGTRTSWTRVNKSGSCKGLDSSIGYFSLGGWHFDLVAVASKNTTPTDEMYDSHSGLVYWGSADVKLKSDTTTVNVVLNRHSAPNTGTLVVEDSVVLLDNQYNTSSTWTYKVFFDTNTDITPLQNTIDMSEGEKTIGTDITVNSVQEGLHTVTILVYDDGTIEGDPQNLTVMYSATKTFVMFGGATVHITGNLDEGLSSEIQFVGDTSHIQPSAYSAYIYNSDGYHNYNSVADAIEAAAEGDTIGLYENVTATLPMCSITIEGNGHIFALSSDINYSEATAGIKYNLNNVVLDLNEHTITTKFNNDVYQSFGGHGFTIKNGTITASTTQSYGLHLGWKFGVSSNGVLENLTIHRGLNVGNASTVELKDVNILKDESATYNGIWCQGQSVVTLTGDSSVTMTSGGNMFAVGWGETQIPIDAGHSGTIEVLSGTYTKGSKTFAYLGNDAVAGTNLKICGGTFDADPTAYVDTDLYNVDHTDSTWTVTPKSGN